MSDLFPELEGGAYEGADAPPPAAPRVPAKLPTQNHVRTVVMGDRNTIRKFHRILNLGELYKDRGGARVHAVELHEGKRIKIEVAVYGVIPTVLFLSSEIMPERYARTRHMALNVRGKVEGWMTPILRQVVFRLQNVTFAELAKQIHHDDLQTPLSRTGYERGDSFVYSYGASAAWRNFFEGREMYRGVPQGLSGNFVQVHHTEIECHFAGTNSGDGAVNFLNYVRTEEDTFRPARRGSTTLMTDLTDRDVIKGGNHKLDKVLDSVADGVERGNIEADVILVKSSCVPVVTGDDIDASLTKLRARLTAGADRAPGDKKKRAIPVLNLRNESDPNAELMRLAMESPSFFQVAKRQRAINVVGLPRIRGFREVFECLEECGIEVNCWALPELDLDSFRGFMAADLNVLHDWDWQPERRRHIIEATRIRAISPPGPFGMEGARGWLAAIADALGRRKVFDAVWSRRFRAVEDTWEEKRREARGFVLGENGVAKLADPAKLMGIPMIPMLREMGFGIDLLLYDTGPSPQPKEDGLRVSHFSTPDDLTDALRESPAVAIYSELYFDRRLTRTGKNIFSSNDFEMGMKGAVSSAARLLKHCKLPFFRTYAKYLGTPFLDQPEAQRHGASAREEVTHVS